MRFPFIEVKKILSEFGFTTTFYTTIGFGIMYIFGIINQTGSHQRVVLPFLASFSILLALFLESSFYPFYWLCS